MNQTTDLAMHRCLAVETVRRNGAAVITPVWIVEYNGTVCFSAPAHTGKVKRLRHTPRGRVAPCKEGGQLLGEWQHATIKPVAAEDVAEIDRLLSARFGWQRRLIDAYGWLRRWQYVHYAIMLEA